MLLSHTWHEGVLGFWSEVFSRTQVSAVSGLKLLQTLCLCSGFVEVRSAISESSRGRPPSPSICHVQNHTTSCAAASSLTPAGSSPPLTAFRRGVCVCVFSSLPTYRNRLLSDNLVSLILFPSSWRQESKNISVSWLLSNTFLIDTCWITIVVFLDFHMKHFTCHIHSTLFETSLL